MARPSKLSPEQWADIERRITGGEVLRDLATEYGISPAAISRKGFTQQSKRVQDVAKRIAETKTALAELPPHQQYAAITLAEKLRNISDSMAAGAELGAKNFHRLSALANNELQKVDDANVLASEPSLKIVAGLTKMANDAAATPINLLAANKDRIKAMDEPEDDPEKPRGVLVVPGLVADTAAWSKAAQAASLKGGE